jgi:hypothetical protein
MSGSTGHSAGRFGTDWGGAEGCGWAAGSAASARGSRPTDRLPLRGQVPWRKHREAACRDSKCCSCHRRPRRARSPERRLPAESMRARRTVRCVSCACCRATSPPWRPPSLSLWRLRFTNCHRMARALPVIRPRPTLPGLPVSVLGGGTSMLWALRADSLRRISLARTWTAPQQNGPVRADLIIRGPNLEERRSCCIRAIGQFP